MAVEISVPGEPQGKARPRYSGATKRVYTPAETRQYEKLIKTLYLQKYGTAPVFPKGVALDMRITAFYAVPASDSAGIRLKKLRGAIRPTKKPDWDNIGKIIADALNGTAYYDDAQIVDTMTRKFYSDTPRVEIKITYAGGTEHEQAP